MWISSLKLNSRPKVPKIAVVWNSLHTYLKENHDADLIMADSQRKNAASSDSTPDDDDNAYSPDELSENDNANNPGNNGNNEPSASSSNTSNGLFVWTQPLIDYLIQKFSSTGAININEDNVAEKIKDFVEDDEFPQDLTPKLKHRRTMFTMEEQSGCDPWIKEIAPFVLKKITKNTNVGSAPVQQHKEQEQQQGHQD